MEQLPQEEPDYDVKLGCILYHEEQYEEACRRFTSAQQVLGYQPGIPSLYILHTVYIYATHCIHSMLIHSGLTLTLSLSLSPRLVLQHGSVLLQHEELQRSPEAHRRDH